MEGSATFTIVWSRMIMRNPAHSTISAIQRERLLSAPWLGVSWAAVSVITRLLGRAGQDLTVADHLVRDDLYGERVTEVTRRGAALDGCNRPARTAGPRPAARGTP